MKTKHFFFVACCLLMTGFYTSSKAASIPLSIVGCDGNKITISAKAALTSASYQWKVYRNDTLIAGSMPGNRTFNYTVDLALWGPGNYYVTTAYKNIIPRIDHSTTIYLHLGAFAAILNGENKVNNQICQNQSIEIKPKSIGVATYHVLVFQTTGFGGNTGPLLFQLQQAIPLPIIIDNHPLMPANNYYMIVTTRIAHCELDLIDIKYVYKSSACREEATEETNDQQSTLSFYPIPMEDQLTVSGLAADIEQAELYNSNGMLVERLKASDNTLHFSTHPQGLYVLKLHLVNGEVLTKTIQRK